MEFKDVDERIKWEARQVAAAFGADTPEEITRASPQLFRYFDAHFRQGTASDNRYLALTFEGEWLTEIEICERVPSHQISAFIRVDRTPPFAPEWELANNSEYQEHMARGLYCLGFEDEEVMSQLPPLSTHEKMELRLSMPREFWPQSWLDKEAK